ncbi:MAG TPA: GNAT family N-acetyltransferase [bacterium]|nr:GNAT family N-acetyltransferase [bacterium]
MEELTIRRYRASDRAAVRKIAWDTAFIGKPADAFFQDKEILADFLTIYFTDYEPESSFVADRFGEAVGYIMGTINLDRMEKTYRRFIIPRLVVKALLRGTLLHKKNLLFLFHCLQSWRRNEVMTFEYASPRLATLHINFAEPYRGKGAGAKIYARYELYLRQARVREIILTTSSPDAGRFFVQQGFRLMRTGERSYYSHITGEKLPVYYYGKRLRLHGNQI